MYLILPITFILYIMVAERKRITTMLKWLGCFMQPAKDKVELHKTSNASINASRKSPPDIIYPDELAYLDEAEDGTYECGCCCLEASFKNLVQCADGHLFCVTCLKKRIEESTFGVLPANGPLACMYMGGCEKFIPWSEIERSMDKGLLRKFEQRQAADDVVSAQIPGLVYCPACNLACIVDPNVVVFRCPSDQCGKTICMKCKEPLHEGTCCKEKPHQTKGRIDVEEIMSKSLIRECVACKVQLVKSSGCNKITCRCGTQMCYTCRQPITGYDHFCQHRKGECVNCGRCNLFHEENVSAKVEAAMKNAVARNPELSNLKIGPQ